MTIRLILAVALGFGLGFPFGIWLTWKLALVLARHDVRMQCLTVPWSVRVDHEGIPESVALHPPQYEGDEGTL